MKENMPQRKNIRIRDYDYSNEGYYFITICTQNRKCLLSEIIEDVKDNKKSVGVGVLRRFAEKNCAKTCRGRRPRRPESRKCKN